MLVEELKLEGVKLIRPKIDEDFCGVFSEVFVDQQVAPYHVGHLVQENISTSKYTGTVRGLHFQIPPFEQGKLVRVVRGAAVRDFVVDLREASLSFGQHLVVGLCEETFESLLVPAGFAHRFETLSPNTAVSYKVTAYYASES